MINLPKALFVNMDTIYYDGHPYKIKEINCPKHIQTLNDTLFNLCSFRKFCKKHESGYIEDISLVLISPMKKKG